MDQYAGNVVNQPPRFMITGAQLCTGPYALPADEAHHALRVLRLRAGDEIVLLDGRGNVATAKIERIRPGEVVAGVELTRHEPAPLPRLIIATAVPKGKRWQVLVEKCTELGVDCIMPVNFRRSVARASGNNEKWRRWAMEACKQCARSWLPEIANPVDLEGLLAHDNGQARLLGVPHADAMASVRASICAASSVIVIIGPEGGLTVAEAEACISAGYLPVKIAQNILRIETAALAACAIVREMSLA